MAMSMGAPAGSMSELNVTPMIDILLVLLVIFMIIVPQVPNGLAAAVPQPPKKAQQNQPDQRAVVVQVQYRSGQPPAFKVNGDEIDNGSGGPAAERDLQNELTKIYLNRAERVMFIKSDGRVDFKWIAQVLSTAKVAGVDHVGLLTPGVQQAG